MNGGILHMFLLMLWCSFRVCLGAYTLKGGQNINGTASLVSADGRFALGFFSPPGNSRGSYYLGIWYAQQSETVVWVANRDKPVLGSESGVFQIADDGKLVVTDTSGSGVTYWSSQPEQGEASTSQNMSVCLMNSGNLVLFQDHAIMWQSFQHPTDTFLPGMKMDRAMELTSWRGDDDPASGSYTFKMTGNNNRYAIFDSHNQLHWDGGPNSLALSTVWLNYFANFTVDGWHYNLPNLTSKSSQQGYIANPGVDEPRYTRIVMKNTGEIQYLKWENDNSEWNLLSKQPSDQCSVYNFCGNFTSCNDLDWNVCKCLPGFKERDHKNGGGEPGCFRESTSSDNDNNDMVFLNLTNVRVGIPDKTYMITGEECQYMCRNMSHPSCQAYSYNQSSYDRSSFICGIWTRDLNTLIVKNGTGAGADLSILVKASDIAPTPKSCEPCGIYMIPYPLSTGPNCGDPTYHSFNCDSSTGQVNFITSGGESHRVTWIDEYDRKVYIQINTNHCDPSYRNGTLYSPFNVTDWCFKEDQIVVSWPPAPEPPCDEPRDCHDWLHSTCSSTSEGTKKCLCVSKYQWNASSLTCTKEEQSRSNSIHRLPLILAVTLAGIVFLSCTIIFAAWRNQIASKIDKENSRIRESLNDSDRLVKRMIGLKGLEEKKSEGIEVPFYTFGSILAATDNFSDSNKLGQGGYGPVYKGKFPGGQDIAIKRLSSVSTQGLEEFKNEVVLIAKLQHRNLVRLRGYCIKGDEKILLYEYMPNKSLDSFIFDRTRALLLDWQMRFDIILGIARGLLYLHQDSILRVIHRDFKTSNILLNEEMIPKISDFGLAKIFGGKETEASTERVVGTYGYMAPEYALDGFFSIKSDVFSFGVVLLEILSGKKNTGFYQSKQTASLLGYTWGLWTENRLLDLMDAYLGETCNENQFIKCAIIGLLCVQDEPGDRPSMSNVVTMLDSEIATIPTPTQPTFYAMKRSSSTTASSSSKPETTTQFDTGYQEGR